MPGGWTLTSIACLNGASADGNSTNASGSGGVGPAASINVSPGESLVCTFTNTQGASLKVVKVTDPASDPQDFDFDLTGPGVPADLDLDTDAGNATLPSQRTFPLSAAQLGAHTVTESTLPDWDLTALVCTGAGADLSTSLANRSATLDIDAGETVGCTYTNTKRAELEIVKATDPANFDKDFAFGITGATASDFDADGSFSLNAKDAASDSQKAFVRPGSYNTTETVPAGWTLTSIACLNGASADGNSTNASGSGGVGPAALINVSPGESLVCTFHEHQARVAEGREGDRPGV